MKQPNIIFLFSDQQRWDTCGCYGQPLDITPNLDRMAEEGVRFDQAFTCQPVCVCEILYTNRQIRDGTGCHTNNRMLPLNEKTIAHILTEHGYDTAYIGKCLTSSGPSDGADDFRTKPIQRNARRVRLLARFDLRVYFPWLRRAYV